jgi:hypothetical protein
MKSREKHHAKASRLRVWKQIAAGSFVSQGESTPCLWERCGIRDLLWIALENMGSKSGPQDAQVQCAILVAHWVQSGR